VDDPLSTQGSGPVSSKQSNDSSEKALMPVTFHSSARPSQQKHSAAVTDSEPGESAKTERGHQSSGIDQFKDPWVRKVAEQASSPIRRKILFDIPCPEDVAEMAANAWIKPRGLWIFDDIVSQKPAPEHVAYASPLDFLWYQC